MPPAWSIWFQNAVQAINSGGGSAWGSITGTLADQTDLQAALNAKQAAYTILTTFGSLPDAAGYLYNDGSGVLSYTTPAGSGTVTTVSVASANGFAGTVANATTTPAITLTTTITGLLKGNGTAISAAAAGTDYQAPYANLTSIGGLANASGALTNNGAGVFSYASYQPLTTNLTSIGGLANALGWLKNDGAGGFSYSTPTASQVGAMPAVANLTLTAPASATTLTLASGSTFTTAGAFAFQFTIPGAFTYTFPGATSTLARSDAAQTFTGVQTFSATSVFTLGHTLTASAAVATAGYMGYDSTQLSHGFFARGVKQMNTTTLFTQTATGTNGANTAITNILGTGTGTAVLPATWTLTGKTVRIRVWGTVTTAAAPGTTVITLRWNAGTPVSIVASPSLTLTASMTSQPFMIDLTATCRSATSVMAGGTFTVSNSTTGISALVVPIGTTTAATVVQATSYTLEVCATNGTASGTVYTTQGASIEVLN